MFPSRLFRIAAVFASCAAHESCELQSALARSYGAMDAHVAHLTENALRDIRSLKTELHRLQELANPSCSNETCPALCPECPREDAVSCPACPKPVDGPCEPSSDRSRRRLPSDCLDYAVHGHAKSGFYRIYPAHYTTQDGGISVFCDMESSGGGWTVVQRSNLRHQARQNFNRSWADYKDGFGDPAGEFWLGNHYLFVLTNQKRTKLRVDLEDEAGQRRYAIYKKFLVAPEGDAYRLTYGTYSGDAGDAFESLHSDVPFSTSDVDNDRNGCPQEYGAGWWYNDCFGALLNGENIFWNAWSKKPLKFAEMKIRPEK